MALVFLMLLVTLAMLLLVMLALFVLSMLNLLFLLSMLLVTCLLMIVALIKIQNSFLWRLTPKIHRKKNVTVLHGMMQLSPQEIARIKNILNHVHCRSITGTLYCTSLEILILEVGMGVHLHTIPKDTLEVLSTESYVKSTCQF